MNEGQPLRYKGPAYSHPCGHLSPSGPDNCPTCAAIKAEYENGRQDEHYAMEETVINLVRNAEDKRGEEVLEMACIYYCTICGQIPATLNTESHWVHIDDDGEYRCAAAQVRQAYKERFGDQG